jgi:hypothetical protein
MPAPDRSGTQQNPTTRQRVGTGGPNRSGTQSNPSAAAAKRNPPTNPPQPLQLDPFNKEYKRKEYGSILRYPYEALTDDTDYLQIDIREYNTVKGLSGSGKLTSDGPLRQGSFNNVGLLTTAELKTSAKRLNAKGTILLPIPSNIQDANSVSYTEGNLDKITSSIYSDLASESVTTTGGSTNAFNDIANKLRDKVQDIGKILLGREDFGRLIATDLLAQAANIPLGGSLTRDQVIARSSGQVLNQNVELLFNGANIRTFNFSFKLTPRNEDEGNQVFFIIESLKKNMAAQIDAKGLFLETPNVFELTYKQGGDKHPFLNSFKQCALTDMSVNYTGEGTYAVYSDATPVSMVLDLTFKELEPIYDLDYDDPTSTGVGY